MAQARRWHIVTGEYPPQPGGVADYTRSVAAGLAAAGDEVIVWAPANGVPARERDVAVHALPGQFGPAALAVLDRALQRRPGRVLLQYTPHAFGYKAMNVPLCAWLWARRYSLDVMFHEVAFPFERGQPWRRHLLAATHRAMASLLLCTAERVFVSIPGWEPMLRALVPHAPRPVWAPVPSNLSTDCSSGAAAAVRQRRLAGSRWLVGHFGTYSLPIARVLEPALVEILTAAPEVQGLLLGAHGQAFADAVVRRQPCLAGRLTASGALDADSAARTWPPAMCCCNRSPTASVPGRGSAMAGLALGRPMVTTDGHLCEPMWRATQAVAIAPTAALGTATLALLADPAHRAALGQRAAALYRQQFAVEHTIRALRSLG